MTYPVFKGATRPVMSLGIPQVPFFFVNAIIVAFAVFVDLPPLAIPLCIIAILIMRGLAAKDDYIFRQLFLDFTMNKARNFNKKVWGVGIYSFSPTKFRNLK